MVLIITDNATPLELSKIEIKNDAKSKTTNWTELHQAVQDGNSFENFKQLHTKRVDYIRHLV